MPAIPGADVHRYKLAFWHCLFLAQKSTWSNPETGLELRAGGFYKHWNMSTWYCSLQRSRSSSPHLNFFKAQTRVKAGYHIINPSTLIKMDNLANTNNCSRLCAYRCHEMNNLSFSQACLWLWFVIPRHAWRSRHSARAAAALSNYNNYADRTRTLYTVRGHTACLLHPSTLH